SFEAEDQDSGLSGAVNDIDVEKVREVTIRLEKRAAGTIVGRVIGIRPTELVRYVSASSVEGGMRSEQVTLSGTFRIENVPTGVVEVQARVGAGTLMRSTQRVEVEVAPGAEAQVELAFPQEVALHGRVTRGGEALSGGNVMFYSAGDFREAPPTGADG